MKRALTFLVLVAACKSQQSTTAAVTLTTPSSTTTSSSITPPPATTVTTRLCGRTDAPRVSADITTLIAKQTRASSMPPPSVEVVEGAATELRDPNVRGAFEKLDTGAIEELRKAGAKWTLAAALGNGDVDVRINAARALGRLRDPAPAAYMTEIARANAHFVSGSEEATLHGIFMHAIADALGECTGTRMTIKDGQDPPGLADATNVWKKKLCP